MNECGELPGCLVGVRLCTDTSDRLIHLTVRSVEQTPKSGSRGRVQDVVPAFLRAMDVGLFQSVKEGQKAEVLSARSEIKGNERKDEWQIMTPPLDVGAFAVLVRMFQAGGAREVTLAQIAPEETLTVFSLEPRPLTERAIRWEVEGHLGEAAHLSIKVHFRTLTPPELASATLDVLRAWTVLVSWGGFVGCSAPVSSAELSKVGISGDKPRGGSEASKPNQEIRIQSEVVAVFERFQATRDAQAALWNGLSRIHRKAPIRQVEIDPSETQGTAGNPLP